MNITGRCDDHRQKRPLDHVGIADKGHADPVAHDGAGSQSPVCAAPVLDPLDPIGVDQIAVGRPQKWRPDSSFRWLWNSRAAGMAAHDA